MLRVSRASRAWVNLHVWAFPFYLHFWRHAPHRPLNFNLSFLCLHAELLFCDPPHQRPLWKSPHGWLASAVMGASIVCWIVAPLGVLLWRAFR